jgi:outer membrane murein-binding lipoprotein Lpp
MEETGRQAGRGDAGLDAAFQIGVHIVSTQRKHLLVMFLWTAVLVWVGMTVVAGQVSALDQKIDNLAVEVRANRSCQCSALMHGIDGVGNALRAARETSWLEPHSLSTPGR